MTNEIRIDDLAAPVLTDLQQMGLDYGESKHTELTVDAVCAAAVARTGLDDFGPDDFRDRLGLQLAEMDADAERTGLGRLLFFGDCVRYAANRLLHPRPARPPPRDPRHPDRAGRSSWWGSHARAPRTW